MGYSRNEIIKAWDQAIVRIAKDVDNLTYEETAAAAAEVCKNCHGLTPEDIPAALASNVRKLEIYASRAKQLLEILEAMHGVPKASELEDVEGGLVGRQVSKIENAIFDGLPKGTLTFLEAVRLKYKQQGNEAVLALLDHPISSTDKVPTGTVIDVEEVARAMAEMFAASAELTEDEPDLDLILDVLGEHFPGITMRDISKAGEIMARRGGGNPLPGLPGGRKL